MELTTHLLKKFIFQYARCFPCFHLQSRSRFSLVLEISCGTSLSEPKKIVVRAKLLKDEALVWFLWGINKVTAWALRALSLALTAPSSLVRSFPHCVCFIVLPWGSTSFSSLTMSIFPENPCSYNSEWNKVKCTWKERYKNHKQHINIAARIARQASEPDLW